MMERKQVLYDLRTTYNGPFIVEDFYAEVDNWIKEKGYEKEPKKKMEHVTKNGKKIEWLIEAHMHMDMEHTMGIIALRALMDNVKEVLIKKNGKKMRINYGNVFINIDGWRYAMVHMGFWGMKPIYYFIRALIDKYIYHFLDRHDSMIIDDCRDLFKRIRAFFGLEKYKYMV